MKFEIHHHLPDGGRIVRPANDWGELEFELRKLFNDEGAVQVIVKKPEEPLIEEAK